MGKAVQCLMRKLGPDIWQELRSAQPDTKKLLDDWGHWQRGIDTPGPKLSISTINRMIRQAEERWKEIDVSQLQKKISLNLGLEDVAMIDVDRAVGATGPTFRLMLLYVWVFHWAPSTAAERLHKRRNDAQTLLESAEALFVEKYLAIDTGK